MTLIRDKILQELLNPSAFKSVSILSFVKSQRKGVTVAQVEDFWATHEDGRAITKVSDDGRRVIDNTIRNTLNDLTEKFLTKEKIGKTCYYHYKEETDELTNNLFDSTSMTDLMRWAITFNKYKGLTFMQELEDLLGLSINDFLVEYDLDSENLRPFIDFETNEHIYSGWGKNVYADDITGKVAEHMAYFYGVISSTNETVEFSYRSFQKGTTRIISNAKPYLLKEHAKRWYLIASTEDSSELYPFSLDRIIEITDRFDSKKYIIPSDFNPSEYWKDCVGIYRDPIKGAQKVSFELKNGPRFNNINYLISSPLHVSQKAIHVDETWMRFEFYIHIGPEVVRHLRQWGIDNLRNIHPNDLDEDVRNG